MDRRNPTIPNSRRNQPALNALVLPELAVDNLMAGDYTWDIGGTPSFRSDNARYRKQLDRLWVIIFG